MRLVLASISGRTRAKSGPAEVLARDYADRAARMVPCELAVFESEVALLEGAARAPGRAAAHLILFDARGELATSESFAAGLGRLRDEGAQRVIVSVGPADGWSAATRAQARQLISLGRMTLPHELARAVMAEQVYRALTILAGHPYHSGHA